jgi:2-methylcitrate dehydratase PrpD
MNSGHLEQIAEWVAASCMTDLPQSAMIIVKRAFLDTLGVTVLGSRLEAARKVASIALGNGVANEGASLMALGRKADAQIAALINGTAAHAALFDDNNIPMIAHPSSPLVSSLIPLAQVRGLSGAELLLAYAVGFEVDVRLGRILNPSLYAAGWHATRVLGVIGSTAACARLLQLDPQRTAMAIGIATSMASGPRQAFGTMTMALHVGLTARDAIHAALLAEAGFEADRGALDGQYGFFRLFAGAQDVPPLRFGGRLELLASGITFKLYPSGAPTHAAVEAALALRLYIDNVALVERVRCKVHPWNFITLRDARPLTPLQAKVSLQYCVAIALHFGRLTEAHFSEAALSDPEIQRLMDRTNIEEDRSLPDNGEFPAEVQVDLLDGRVLIQRCQSPRGGTQFPIGDAELRGKFENCVAHVFDRPTAQRIEDMIAGLDSSASLDELCIALEGTPYK